MYIHTQTHTHTHTCACVGVCNQIIYRMQGEMIKIFVSYFKTTIIINISPLKANSISKLGYYTG